jgi:hypothetical protein
VHDEDSDNDDNCKDMHDNAIYDNILASCAAVNFGIADRCVADVILGLRNFDTAACHGGLSQLAVPGLAVPPDFLRLCMDWLAVMAKLNNCADRHEGMIDQLFDEVAVAWCLAEGDNLVACCADVCAFDDIVTISTLGHRTRACHGGLVASLASECLEINGSACLAVACSRICLIWSDHVSIAKCEQALVDQWSLELFLDFWHSRLRAGMDFRDGDDELLANWCWALVYSAKWDHEVRTSDVDGIFARAS